MSAEHSYLLAGILISAAITWAMRAVPFGMLAPLRDSELLAYLGARMPVGIMLILALYTVRDVNPTEVMHFGPTVLGIAITVVLQLWRGSATLSIFSGTAVYVALSSAVAAAGA